ncbi:hypothetical protein [Streptomyces sp. H27-D2]|uniref:hypothetical protein n=1 Tax=Streptomyces sp. H27-D2 TaxID=3046304 RepID=UPI002DBA2FAF|nr:hypothetical protein [Streptomyces sp. H27-D2]MEC4019692.1 hypothetical protein [Streptomyces sp. H27-D2]
MTRVDRYAPSGGVGGLLAVAAALLATSCSAGNPGHEASASPSPTSRANAIERTPKDDPNLLAGFRSWLRSNSTARDGNLADHALAIALDCTSEQGCAAQVLTDYGPWGGAESEVRPLARAFKEWWDDDPAAGAAYFLSQGGTTVKEAPLYSGDEPTNLLTEFRSWTSKNVPSGSSLASRITSLSIGYGARGPGAATVSTNYLTYKDPRTQEHLNAIADAFATWWDDDAAAGNVVVNSHDQGTHAQKKLTTSDCNVIS